MEIFKLFGSILVNNDEANKNISKTDEKAEGLGKKFLKGVGTAAKWGTAIVGAAGAGGAALFGMADKAAGTTDRIDKMSQKIGMSREAFQEFDFICSQSGMSVDKLQGGFKTLTSQISSAAEGNATATEAFKTLGISIEDLKTMSREDIFKKSISALQNVSNETEKATLANKLFGKAGSEMMPLLNGASGSVEEMAKKAHELGLVLGDEAIDAGVKFTDTVDQAKRSLGAIGDKIGVSVMPIVQSFLEFILDKTPLIQSVLGGLFKGIEFFVSIVTNVIVSLGDKINDKFGWIIDKVVEMKNTFKSSMDEFDDYGLAFKSMLEVIMGPIGDLPIFEEIGKIMSAIHEIIARVKGGEGIAEAFKAAFEWRDSSIGNALLDLMGFCTTIFQSIESVIRTVIENLGPIFDGLKNLFSITMSVLATSWESWGKPIWGFFVEAVQKVAEVFNYVWPIVANIFSGVCDTLNNLWVSILQPVFQAIGAFLQAVLLPIFSLVFNCIANAVMTAFNFIGTLWNTVLKPILDGIINFVGGIFSGNWSQVWTGITQILSGIWGYIKMIIWSPIEWVINKIGGVVESITAPFRQAADAIGNIWSSIKSVFKLPHFTFSGSMNPLKWLDEGLPKIGVEWYAKGGVMHQPTVFGMNGPNAMVGGEAGPEAVAPIETLMDYVRTAVAEGMGNNSVDYNRLFRIMVEAFTQAIIATGMNNMAFYVDKEKLGQAMAGTNDKIDGQRMKLAERGLILE